MSRRGRRLAVALVVILSATLVGTYIWHRGDRNGYVVDGPVLATELGWREPKSSMAMNVVGRLALDDGGCLRLGDPDDAVLWPSGTTWDEDDRAVVLADGTTIHLGDTLEAGGGLVGEQRDRVFEESERGRLSHACRGEHALLVLAEELDWYSVTPG